MPSRDQVMELLDLGHTYETAAGELGIAPGLAYMIATGMPADGSDTPAPEELHGQPELRGGSQQLVNPPSVNPVRRQAVLDWVRERATHDLAPGS
jgi:hypothetical protein